MKDNHRFRLDVWGVITLAILAMDLLFMVYPLSNLIKMAFYGDNGFTLDHFIKFFSKKVKEHYHIGLFDNLRLARFRGL